MTLVCVLFLPCKSLPPGGPRQRRDPVGRVVGEADQVGLIMMQNEIAPTRRSP